MARIEELKNGTTRFTTHRDSLVNNDEHSYQPIAGYYLAHLTSPEDVFLHFWDDRAFTKNYEDAFKYAFGMTLIEFNNKFYDWMMDIEEFCDGYFYGGDSEFTVDEVVEDVGMYFKTDLSKKYAEGYLERKLGE